MIEEFFQDHGKKLYWLCAPKKELLKIINCRGSICSFQNWVPNARIEANYYWTAFDIPKLLAPEELSSCKSYARMVRQDDQASGPEMEGKSWSHAEKGRWNSEENYCPYRPTHHPLHEEESWYYILSTEARIGAYLHLWQDYPPPTYWVWGVRIVLENEDPFYQWNQQKEETGLVSCSSRLACWTMEAGFMDWRVSVRAPVQSKDKGLAHPQWALWTLVYLRFCKAWCKNSSLGVFCSSWSREFVLGRRNFGEEPVPRHPWEWNVAKCWLTVWARRLVFPAR